MRTLSFLVCILFQLALHAASEPLFVRDRTDIPSQVMARLKHKGDVFHAESTVVVQGTAQTSRWGGLFKAELKNFMLKSTIRWTEVTLEANSNGFKTQLTIEEASTVLTPLNTDIEVLYLRKSVVDNSLQFVISLASGVGSIANQIPVVGDSGSVNLISRLLARIGGLASGITNQIGKITEKVDQLSGARFLTKPDVQTVLSYFPQNEILSRVQGLALQTNKFTGRRIEITYVRGRGTTYVNLPDNDPNDPDAQLIRQAICNSARASSEIVRIYLANKRVTDEPAEVPIPGRLLSAIGSDLLEIDTVEGDLRAQVQDTVITELLADETRLNPKIRDLSAVTLTLKDTSSHKIFAKKNNGDIVFVAEPQGTLSLIDDKNIRTSYLRKCDIQLMNFKPEQSSTPRGFFKDIKYRGELTVSFSFAQARSER